MAMTPPASPSRPGRGPPAAADDDDDDDEQHSPEWHLWPPTTRRLPPALALALALYALHARTSQRTDAPVAAVLQHYTELLDSHGLALMLGGAPRGAAGLDVRELQLVAQLVPHFHTTPGGVALLRRFNEGAAAAGSGEIHLEIIAAVQALAAPAAKPASAPAPAPAPAPA